MKIIEKLKSSRNTVEAWTLTSVTTLSFIATGALLLGWDMIEHAYLREMSGANVHRMHMIRGISTGVLVSVGIAALLLRSRMRHETSVQALQQELIRKERLAAVGELAGGVAHEIRNPLAGIGGALEILAREIPADDDTREMMEEIQHQLDRMERLVQDLLAYARPGVLHPEWTDLHAVLKQATTSVAQRPNVPKAELVLQLDERVPEIYADPRELEHAFENLILNAFQAIAEGGRIAVCTQRYDGSVRVSIRDDGPGMDPDVRERIFEPFFTTKSRGTGLGLSLVRRAIENYGGEISVESAPGTGTCFYVLLPIRRASAEAVRARRPPFDPGL